MDGDEKRKLLKKDNCFIATWFAKPSAEKLFANAQAEQQITRFRWLFMAAPPREEAFRTDIQNHYN